MDTLYLYILSALIACAATAFSLPLLRRYAGAYLIDRPCGLKKHDTPIPVVGGSAILLGLAASLLFIRLTTAFPSGTLHSLRGILIGGSLIFALGLADDFKKPQGISIAVRLVGQAAAALILIHYGVHISLFNCPALSYILTLLWVIGITNAFNLLDISDGLCVSQAVVCCLGLCVIALPSEFIYVNFGACALLGACAGFWPYNHSNRLKTFLGDSGSTLLGFIIAALSMGSGYSEHSNLGFLAPLLILAIPLFDTTFVCLMRLCKRKNPLCGSNDHAALRLMKIGLSKNETLLLFTGAALFFNILAFAVTKISIIAAATVYFVAALIVGMAALFLSRIRMKG